MSSAEQSGCSPRTRCDPKFCRCQLRDDAIRWALQAEHRLQDHSPSYSWRLGGWVRLEELAQGHSQQVRGQGSSPGSSKEGLRPGIFGYLLILVKQYPVLRLCKIGCVPGSCILLLWFQTPSRHHPQCPEDSHGLYLPSRKCRRNLLLVQLFRYFKSHIFNSVLCQVYHDGLKLK